MLETPFIGYFLERYLMIPSSQISRDYHIRGRSKSLRQTESSGGIE